MQARRASRLRYGGLPGNVTRGSPMNVRMMRRAAQALAEGIPVGLSTDSSCPYVTQYDMWCELAYFFMALPA
ncbi:MAG: hypothetical protein ACLUPX_04690 [Atopobiaceae bacterium]